MEERLTRTLDWLYSLEARGEIYKLERMENALALLGNPHRKLRVVHIAGTKGKGSVAAMLDAVLRAAGMRGSPCVSHSGLQIGRTCSARGPLGPWVTVYSTRWLSWRLR